MTRYNTPVSSLPGIGTRRQAALARLGIFTAGGLLMHFPSAYQNRGNVKTIAEAKDGEVVSLELTVASTPNVVRLPGASRRTMLKFSAVDETGRVSVVYFNQDYLKDSFQKGTEGRFFGRLTLHNGVKTLGAPDFEPLHGRQPLRPLTPVYPLTAGITRKLITSLIADLLELGIDMPTALPESVRQAAGLCTFDEALRWIHFPDTYEALAAAREYFICEELFTFACSMKLARRRGDIALDAPKIIPPEGALERFYASLPFAPTGAQRRSIAEIAADMTGSSGQPMSRILTGDVGSGKTLCAAAAAYLAVCGGFQAAVMAPTEILARQHYEELSQLLSPFGISCALLCGATKASERTSILDSLAMGTLHVLIGTHALITPDVIFSRLGLAVTDEQHRFGVRQRAALTGSPGENEHPHVLVMSATPIPRTLALVLYGDMSHSVLDEMPPGRQKVDTFVVNESYRQRLEGFILKQVSEGHQVYIVCPAVENEPERDEEDGELYFADRRFELPDTVLKSAVEYAADLGERYPKLCVGLVHGRMKSSEKESVMSDFAANRIHVLVSTTVIEVGVNVPNATLMVIENAERFGLSQLHQLRGRVGRGGAKSWCILVSDTRSENAKKRLAVMKETNDGNVIAERDLELRGPGDFLPLGTGRARQHGDAGFRLASLGSDMSQLKAAFAHADELLSCDPSLEKEEHRGLREALKRFDKSGIAAMLN
ncbi:MAG: ATP-dependent DNA helicase RecG [Clostridiales bacterium]|nr:ATP-dependent DNA helicase RecG [Clostridiales bacterium]